MTLSKARDKRDSIDIKPESQAISYLKLQRLTNEKIKNKQTKSQLELIYLDDAVIVQVKQENQPSASCYSFNFTVARRIKTAWEWSAEEELIAIASTSVDSLIVMGCDLTTWEIPFESHPGLAKIPPAEKSNFKLDVDGSYLYWKSIDLHVDLEELKAAVNPEFKEQLLLEKLEYGKSLGKAIAVVRKAHQLTQNKISGISDRHLRRIENEGQQPTLEILKKLSAAHELDLETYLTEVNEALITNKLRLM
ncbi:MAG: helix-turn-helix domain-containing protein [Cyanobacteria bacterium P01_A01_bin.40]